MNFLREAVVFGHSRSNPWKGKWSKGSCLSVSMTHCWQQERQKQVWGWLHIWLKAVFIFVPIRSSVGLATAGETGKECIKLWLQEWLWQTVGIFQMGQYNVCWPSMCPLDVPTGGQIKKLTEQEREGVGQKSRKSNRCLGLVCQSFPCRLFMLDIRKKRLSNFEGS